MGGEETYCAMLQVENRMGGIAQGNAAAAGIPVCGMVRRGVVGRLQRLRKVMRPRFRS